MAYYLIRDSYNPRRIITDEEEARRIAEGNPGYSYSRVGLLRALFLKWQITSTNRSVKDLSRVVDSK